MPVDHLSTTFTAFADPHTPRAGEMTVNQLAKPFDVRLPAVSKHLKVLERAGLIVRGRKVQRHPCRIEPTAFKDVDEWLEEYRRL
ncbi:MAG: helix-turn-helix transcriptional regulator [Alphaproteobacteria bacterium]|nr:helix-turn-helix transcriptional regulator [Alphaproteobacteria bacterium]MDE2494101.1 helix-turn-helix transcriptional regulator [Alphaproteobacteria bacterium]